MYLFMTALFHEQMLRICPQYEYNSCGGALAPLRSGLVQMGCQKSGKTTADISDNARAALCKRKEIIIFRGVIQGQRYRMIPAQYTNSERQMIKRLPCRRTHRNPNLAYIVTDNICRSAISEKIRLHYLCLCTYGFGFL